MNAWDWSFPANRSRMYWCIVERNEVPTSCGIATLKIAVPLLVPDLWLSLQQRLSLLVYYLILPGLKKKQVNQWLVLICSLIIRICLLSRYFRLMDGYRLCRSISRLQYFGLKSRCRATILSCPLFSFGYPMAWKHLHVIHGLMRIPKRLRIHLAHTVLFIMCIVSDVRL